jgi:hypothetical protein
MTAAARRVRRARPRVASSEYAVQLLDLEAARAELLRLYEAGVIDARELPTGVLELR